MTTFKQIFVLFLLTIYSTLAANLITLPSKNAKNSMDSIVASTIGQLSSSCQNTGNCDSIKIAFEYAVNDLRVEFNNVSNGHNDDEYTWSFGDGSVSSLRSPTHTYQETGIYNFCLSVSNNRLDCNKQFCSKVYVFNPF